MKASMTFDGGSRGNPGPSAAAAIVCLDDGMARSESEYLGTETNNVAEYKGLQIGLRLAEAMGVTHISIIGDSKLVVCHVNRTWECRAESLKPLLEDVLETLDTRFESWNITHKRRDKNVAADALVNVTLDKIKRLQKTTGL